MKRRVQLQVEELGQRILPSVTTLGRDLPTPRPGLLGSSSFQYHHLQGTGRGMFTRIFLGPVLGVQFHLQGAGTFNDLGRAQITGDLYLATPGKPRAHGTIKLSNAHGSLTLSVTPSAPSPSGPLPSWYNYHVVAATGAYKLWRDQGMLQLVKKYTIPNGGVFHLTII